jgi:hypothetical protein
MTARNQPEDDNRQREPIELDTADLSKLCGAVERLHAAYCESGTDRPFGQHDSVNVHRILIAAQEVQQELGAFYNAEWGASQKSWYASDQQLELPDALGKLLEVTGPVGSPANPLRLEAAEQVAEAWAILKSCRGVGLLDVKNVADFVAWIDATLNRLNSADADAVAWDYWPTAWDDAVAYADALGLSNEVDALGGPIRPPTFVCEKHGEYDYDTPAKAIRDNLRNRLVQLRVKLTGSTPEPDGPCDVDQWRHDGVKTNQKMQPQTWKLAKRLHESLGEKVHFADLIGAGGVFVDDLTSDQNIQRQGSRLKKWFREQGIPLTVSSSTTDRFIWMAKSPDA